MKSACIVLLAFLLQGCLVTSEGERVGQLKKLAKTGWICKTNEGDMSLGIMKNGSGSVSKEDFEFTVEDEAVVAKVKEALETGRPVKLFYRKEALTFCRTESIGNYFVYDVKYLD